MHGERTAKQYYSQPESPWTVSFASLVIGEPEPAARAKEKTMGASPYRLTN